jgi:hypothetical protein
MRKFADFVDSENSISTKIDCRNYDQLLPAGTNGIVSASRFA